MLLQVKAQPGSSTIFNKIVNLTGPEDDKFLSLKNEDSLIHLSVPVFTTTETEISTKEQPGPISEPSEKPAPSIQFLASKVAETTSELQSKIGLALGSEL